MFRPSLRDVRFSGEGALLGNSRRVTFARTGRELGLDTPVFSGGELALGYRHTYFGVGASGFFAFSHGPDAKPTDAEAAASVGSGSMRAYGGGIELYGALPLDRVTLSAGAAAGFRAFSMPLLGFETHTCTTSSRRGSTIRECRETASSTVTPYVQPRIRFDVALGEARTFFVGGYVGLDVLGDRTMAGGLVIGLRLAAIAE